MFKLSKKVYLDSFSKCYKNIVIINGLPSNDFKNYTKFVSHQSLSPFNRFDCCAHEPTCQLAFVNESKTNFITVDEIDKVINIIISLGYKIDYNLTKIMLKNKTDKHLLFYITKQ